MKFIETKLDSGRYVNMKEVCQILLKKETNRVLFNFTSIVEKTDGSKKLLPAFHYVDFNEKSQAMKELQRYIQEANKMNIPMFVFTSEKYNRIVNFDNVNSFYIKEDEEGFAIFINFNTSISSDILDGLTEHSIKITDTDKNVLKEFKEFLKKKLD